MFFLGILNTVGIFFDQNVVSFDPVHLAALLSFPPEGPPALLSPSTLKEGGKKGRHQDGVVGPIHCKVQGHFLDPPNKCSARGAISVE